MNELQPGPIPAVPNQRTTRKFNLEDAAASDELLTALEEKNIFEVNKLLAELPEGITTVLNTPSLKEKHMLRTPLMAAAATGDYSKWAAMFRAFDEQFVNKLQRDTEMRMQLANRDENGMTLAMIAARSKNVAVVASVMSEIEDTEAKLALEAHDYKRMSLLTHSASVGPAPIFHEVHESLVAVNGSEEVLVKELLHKSADDKTIIMHAAKSGDAMLLKMVADACRMSLSPGQVRTMITERDSDGLNFLMHAASCRTSTYFPASGTQAKKGSTSAGTSEATSHDASGTATGSTAGGNSTTPAEAVDNTSGDSASSDNESKSAATAEKGVSKPDASGTSKSRKGGKAKITVKPQVYDAVGAVVVPVWKIALGFVKDCLWKNQVLDELRAIDSWGRSVLTHALLSGHGDMFEAVLDAVRDHISDEEISEMLETNEGEREDVPMINALAQGDAAMQQLYSLRVCQIKKDVQARSKLSTVNAKIESFIPGKLIVLFQLLRPQLGSEDQFLLLLIMSALAPLISLGASAATSASSKYKDVTSRSNPLSALLGAPAMFFWGLGTSTIGQTSFLQWSATMCSTAMAVATIVIPAIDHFFSSKTAASIGEKICCQEWFFHFNAWVRWHKLRWSTASETKGKRSYYSTFGGFPAGYEAIEDASAVGEATRV